MKHILKKSLSAIIMFAALQGFAAPDEAAVIINYPHGRSTETCKLQKVGADTYRLHIPFAKISKYWKIESVDVIHSEAVAKMGEDGYWVIADGRLGKFNHSSGLLEERRHPMPLYGVKKGDSAFVGIVKGLKYEFSMRVDVKDSVYKIYPRFKIADMHTKPYEDIVIDFTFFKGADANYSSMARAYRKYQLGRGEVKPLKERVEGNPTLANSVNNMFVKFCTAWYMRDSDLKSNRGDHWKVEDDPPLTKYCDFEEFKGVMRKWKAAGIDSLDICLTNWNLRANGRNPTCSIAEPELGGNAKLKELTALAKKLNYQIAPHILHTEHYTISDEFNAEDIALDHNGKYLGYPGMGGKGFNPCFKQVFKNHVLEHYDRMRTLGFTLMHIDVTSCIVPYPCFHINHFINREECAYYMNRVGMLSDAFFGVWSSEGPMDQVANTLDYALYVSAHPRYLGSATPLMDRMVPIWQLAYHGIIMSNPFIYTIDYNLKSKPAAQKARLKLVEFGGRTTFYWAVNKTTDPSLLKLAYDEYNARKYLQYEFMDFHGEIAPDVFITKYSDGSETVCNYSNKAFSYNGKTVQPMDYILIKPAKK